MSGNKKHIFYSLLIVILLSSPAVLNGQKPTVKADPQTLKLIREVPDEKGKETGAIIILRDYQMTINEKSLTRLVLRVVGKVYSKEAIADYSQIPLAFNSYYEEPILNYARVIYKDGSVREVQKDAVQIKTSPESEGLQYTDSRYISFALSGLEIGAAFDYQLTFVQKVPIIEGEWYDNHLFANLLRNLSPPYLPRTDPTLISHYTLLLPRGSKFQYRMRSGEAEPMKRSINNQDEYRWTLTDLPSITFEEAMPPISTLSPILLVSSLKEWSQIDQWAAKKLLSKVKITGEIGAKTKELISGKKSDDEKIEAISAYIQANIHYIYADLDRGGYEAHPAGEILKSRYGDCKDQAILLISMLKAAGIEAYPALLNPFPYDEFPDIPTVQFSHLITYIPKNGRDLWLDMTSGVTPFPNLYFRDQGRVVFIVNGKGGRLTKTPVNTTGENVSTFDLQASLNDRKGIVSMIIKTSGVQSDLLKSVFKTMDATVMNEVVKKLVVSFAEKAVTDSIIFSDLHNSDIPFSVSIRYHIDSLWQKGQGEIVFGSHSFYPLTLLSNSDVRSFPEKRHNDIVEGYPYTIIGNEKYHLPVNDLLPVQIPKNDSINNEFFNFIQRFTRDASSTTVNWSLTFNNQVIPKEKYEPYLNSLRSLKEMTGWSINYVNPVTYIPSAIKTGNSNKILGYCNQVLKDDPKNILALLLRGMVYNKTGQYDQAIGEFQEVLKISPGNKYAYFYMSFPFFLKKNPVMAIGNLNKSIEIDPEFEMALLTRCAYYSDQGLYDKALADVNTVQKINPKNVICLQTRAAVLSKMGKEKESLATLEELLNIDSMNVQLCTGLALLYLNKNEINKAIEFYRKAIVIDSRDPSSYGNLGWAYYLANDDSKCIEYSEKAIEIKPDSYYARYNLGLAHLRSGNIPEARRIYGELKKEAGSIPVAEKKGAVKDLNDLKAKGNHTQEVKAILKDFF